MLISYLFFALGLFFILVSTLGLFRFNCDPLMKVHAMGITDVMGLPLLCCGLLVQHFVLFPKLLLLVVVLFITSATSSYLSARIIYCDH